MIQPSTSFLKEDDSFNPTDFMNGLIHLSRLQINELSECSDNYKSISYLKLLNMDYDLDLIIEAVHRHFHEKKNSEIKSIIDAMFLNSNVYRGMVQDEIEIEIEDIEELLLTYIILHTGDYSTLDPEKTFLLLDFHSLLDYFEFYCVYIAQNDLLDLRGTGVEFLQDELDYLKDEAQKYGFDYITNTLCIYGERLVKPLSDPSELFLCKNVRIIECEFLPNMDLSSIDLKPLSKVICIRKSFLHANNLTSIDLSPLSNVRKIGNYFLNHNNLIDVDLSPMRELVAFGDYFLSRNSLTKVTLPNMEKITNIGSHFMFRNYLTSVDLSGFSKIATIGDNFLSQNNLISIDLPAFSEVTTIGAHFLSNNQLASVDLSAFSKVVAIGNNFLAQNRLTSVDLSAFSAVTTIGDRFLTNNRLTSVDLSAFSKVVTIGDMFLINNQLTSVDLSPLVNINTIGRSFLENNKLTNVNLMPLNRASQIRMRMLEDNPLNKEGQNNMAKFTLFNYTKFYGM